MESKEDVCVIISGGQYSPIKTGEADYIIAGYIIACDKGFEYAMHEGIKPDLVIGDFDSCDEKTKKLLAEWEEKEAQLNIERYPSEKDDTDTMLAIKKALALGYRRIEIYCGLGGRMDHLYANMQSLVYGARHGAVCSIEDADNVIYALGAGGLELPMRKGWSISLFAVTDVCRGITTEGLKYPLRDGELVNSFPLGMSNEWITESATVELKEGIMLVMLSKKEAM